MARKLNLLKLPRENDAAPETLSRRPHQPTATLYLMQLRSHALKIAPPDCIRLEVNAETVTDEDPKPVKIVWIDESK